MISQLVDWNAHKINIHKYFPKTCPKYLTFFTYPSLVDQVTFKRFYYFSTFKMLQHSNHFDTCTSTLELLFNGGLPQKTFEVELPKVRKSYYA